MLVIIRVARNGRQFDCWLTGGAQACDISAVNSHARYMLREKLRTHGSNAYVFRRHMYGSPRMLRQKSDFYPTATIHRTGSFLETSRAFQHQCKCEKSIKQG